MAEYTDRLENIAYDDDLFDGSIAEVRARLEEVVGSFRPLREALSSFLLEKGFVPSMKLPGEKQRRTASRKNAGKNAGQNSGQGSVKNPNTGALDPKQTAFLKQKFKDAGIKLPRNLNEGFAGKESVEKLKVGYQICFALSLDPDESNDFFRRILLCRGIDLHDPREAVYYFCLKKKIPYTEAAAIAKRVEAAHERYREECPHHGTGVSKTDINGELYYTSAIRTDIDRIGTKEQLEEYLAGNAKMFITSNVTATETVKRLWNEITGNGGLAERELESEKLLGDIVSAAPPKREPKQQQNQPTGTDSDARSTWDVYKQILGLEYGRGDTRNDTRSIKDLLKNSSIVHRFVEEDFPDRQGIEKITGGKKVSSERLRKVLILLTFYDYWAGLAIKRDDYEAECGDTDRCLCIMDQTLTESGFEALYYGNPFDWIFLYAMNSEYPLLVFREYMEHIVTAKKAAEAAEMADASAKPADSPDELEST